MAAVLAFAGVASAADNTLRLDPPTGQVPTGGTFSLKVILNATVPTSGVSASITFDKSIVQVTGVTRGTAFSTAPLFLAGDAAAISAANKSGKLQAVAAAFFPPTSVPAGEQEFITVAFKAVGCGTVTMTVPAGKVDAALLDGRAKTYGASLKLVTAGATITVCDGAAGSPGASADASGLPGPSDGSSFDPNATAGPGAGGSTPPGGVVVASAPPTSDGGTGGTTSESSGWLNFAIAALAVAAAGLATLVIVLTVIAIVAAIVGAVVVIRVWRRYSLRGATPATVAAAAETTPAAGAAADRPIATDVPDDLGGLVESPTTVIPVPATQQS